MNSNTYEKDLSVRNGSRINTRDGLTFLLVGGGIGAVIALLFAPKSGRDMRHDIADVSRRGYDLTIEKANAIKAQSAEKLSLVKEKAGAVYDLAASKLESSRELLADAIDTGSTAISEGLNDVQNDAKALAGHAAIGRKSASSF